jgi:hypothetical protein
VPGPSEGIQISGTIVRVMMFALPTRSTTG